MQNIHPYISEVFRHKESSCPSNAHIKLINNCAVEAGYSYFDCHYGVFRVSHDIYPLQREAFKRQKLRIEFDVPFREKDLAKAAGAKWDKDKRLWYATSSDADLLKLLQWCREEDKVYLEYPLEHRNYVLTRAHPIVSGGEKLYVPSWYWGVNDLLYARVRTRLCYWWPKHSPDFLSFGDSGEAARWLCVNTYGGYMPVSQYLPKERASLEQNKAIYICDIPNQEAYFRYRHWDSY